MDDKEDGGCETSKKRKEIEMDDGMVSAVCRFDRGHLHLPFSSWNIFWSGIWRRLYRLCSSICCL